MDPLRIHVSLRGSAYVAKSDLPDVVAVGSSPAQAAENARLMARSAFGSRALPAAMIVRCDEHASSTFVMQPTDEPVSLEAGKTDQKWRYFASVDKSRDSRSQ